MSSLNRNLGDRLRINETKLDTVQENNAILTRLATLIEESHARNDPGFEHQFSAQPYSRATLEGNDSMLSCIQKSVDSMRNALEVSMQASFDRKLREMREETKKVMLPLEHMLRSILLNQAVSLREPQLLVDLMSDSKIQP